MLKKEVVQTLGWDLLLSFFLILGTEDIASGGTAPKKTSLKKEKQLVSSSKQNSGKFIFAVK